MEDEEETLEVTRLERAPRPSGFTGDASTVREGFSSDSDLPPSEAGPPELPEGTRVDHYRVMRLLGRGGMGEVYLARDTQLGRKVALKIVLPDVLRSESEKQRFLFEARTTAALNHPHIVTIYGTGAYDDRPYVALEYLEGQNLRERLRERTPSLPETLRICLAIVEALAHAHENGILHRDLKPANVVIAQDGRLRVVDFGLAKVLADDDGDEDGPSFIPGLTQLQKLGEDTWTAGTPSYMAPEQWRGESGGGATDLWALGVLLFELCAGRKPFEADSSIVLAAAVCSREPSPALAGDFPKPLVELVARCLDKAPEGRPGAREVADLLRKLVEATTEAPQEEPFRGLLPFNEHHAGSFFGRESEVAAFLERLRLQPLLAVVGPSGAGKSSLVRAGVFPRLREQGPWQIVDLRPQGRPFRALSVALATLFPGETAGDIQQDLESGPAALSLRLRRLAEVTSTRVLLFVDQMEELFTLAGPDVAKRFLAAVYACADDVHDPLRVAYTLRQDFLDRLAFEPQMSAAAFGGIIVVQRPSREALARILRQPVQARGYRFEDEGMVDEMVNAVADSPACLPLLSFAARRLWDERDDEQKLLLRQAYDAMGGVEGALASHADGVIGGFSRHERQVGRELFLRLVTAERTRKLVPKTAALEGLGRTGEEVLERLREARLVNLFSPERGETVVELAHESLIQTWHQLARWLDESRDDLVFLEEVSQAAELWKKRGSRPEELWQGDALLEASRAVERLTAEVPRLVVDFLAAGKQHMRRRRTRRRVLVSLAFVALAAVAVVLALQKREADAQRALAEEREQQSEARRAEALREGARAALREQRLLEARAKLRSALEIEDDPAARALWWQLSQEPLRWLAPLATTSYAVAYSPDGALVATACQDGAVYLVDAVDRSIRILRGHGDQVFAVAFAPDGETLASGSFDGVLRIWDRATGRALHEIQAHRAGIWTVAYSPDGREVATASADGTVGLWDSADGSERRVLRGHEADVFGVAYAPDGRRLVTSSFDRHLRLWDLASGRSQVLAGHEGHVFTIAFSPDGRQIASGGRDAVVRLWRADTGTQEAELRHAGGVFGLAYSPDGERLATSSVGGEVELWDLRRRERLATLGRHDAVALAVAFSPDGRALVSGGDDRTLRLWSTDVTRARPMLEPHETGVNRVAVSPDGKLIASSGHDRTIRLWRRDDGTTTRVLEGHDAIVRAVAFSPDGEQLATGSHDQDVRLWRVATGAAERTLVGHRGPIFGLAYSPDGRRLATGSRDRTVRIWNLASGREEHVLEGHTSEVRDVVFSPDGELVASGGGDRTIRLWDAATGAALEVIEHHEGGVEGLAFSPDGALIASGGLDQKVRLWERKRGEGHVLGDHGARVYSIDFHPNGRLVGAPDSEGLVRLWPLDESPILLRGHANEVNAVRFSPDGLLAVTGSDDGTVRTWEVATGRPAWRGVALVGAPLRALTHRGWAELDGRPTTAPPEWSEGLVRAAERDADDLVVSLDLACSRSGDRLAIWALDGSAPLATHAIEGESQLVPSARGCALLDAGEVRIFSRSETRRIPVQGVVAVGRAGDGLFVALDDRVETYDAAGERRATQPASLGVTVVAGEGDDIFVGYRDGHVEALGDDDALPFEETPNAVPTTIVLGPAEVVIVGYSDGTVGMWPRRGGARLARGRLHGRIRHIAGNGQALHALSDLGQLLSWNLEAFHESPCDVLGLVWREVPVVWEGGRAVAKAPPLHHPCRQP